jgi:hypothetical protein
MPTRSAGGAGARLLDPFNSGVALRLMHALEAAGDRSGAIQHARIHAALLREELDADPDADVAAFAERLRLEPPRRAEACCARSCFFFCDPPSPSTTVVAPEPPAASLPRARRVAARSAPGGRRGSSCSLLALAYGVWGAPAWPPGPARSVGVLPVRQHERGSGQHVLQRRPQRADHPRAQPHRRTARRRAHVIVRAAQPRAERARHRRHARRAGRAGGQRARER